MVVKKYQIISSFKRKFSGLKDNTLIDKWMKQVNNKANSNDGKIVVGQLNSLMNYYNKIEEI